MSAHPTSRRRIAGISLFALCAAAPIVGLVTSADAKKDDLHPSVVYAKTWEAAVEEAKLLNVPIVVHSHGFFCPPCWGMHSALLQNDDYIKFAGDNTVEVIALQRLDEGIENKDRRAETYEVEVAGQKVQYLKEFPGMTVAEMNAINSSPGGRYNDTGGIPFTCLVDPWTLEKGTAWSGGQSAGTIMDAVTEMRKSLEKEHGKGIARKDIRKIDEARDEAGEAVAKQDYVKALKVVDTLAKKAKDLPEPLTKRVDELRRSVLDAATKTLDEIEAMEDKKEAKKLLVKIKSKFKGTGCEERAESLFATLG